VFDHVETKSDKLVRVEPKIEYPAACGGTTSTANVSSTTTWTLDGDAYDTDTGLTQGTWTGTVLGLMNNVDNQGQLVIPAGTLLDTRSYTFTCSVSTNVNATVGQAKVTVTVTKPAIEAKITGGYDEVSTTKDITLDASGTIDPAATTRRL
jgi:hypothetical protein